MSITTQECGAVILAGGGSRRMGQNKALLMLNGQTMLERTLSQLSAFDEILLSANDPSLSDKLRLPCIPDTFEDHGPLSGLHAALSATRKEALFCVPCDLPYFTAELAQSLLDHMPPDIDAFICRDSSGKLHPLCGIFHRRILPILEQALLENRCRVLDLLEQITWSCAPLSLPDNIFLNMNSPDEYRAVTEALQAQRFKDL